MALLVGQETEGAAASTTVSTERAIAFQFTAAASGTVTALHALLNTVPATAVRIALCEGGTKPGAVLCEGEKATPGKTVEITGFSQAVTAGTKYWLVVMMIGTGGTVKGSAVSGGAVSWKSGTSHTKISEITSAQWSVEETRGTAGFWATGTESGETKTVTALVHGAGASSVNALKVATPSALVTGAGLASTKASKTALASAGVTGAGASTVKASKTASTTALVHGAGNATVTITPSGEVKTVTALVHGAGRSTVSVLRIALATAKVSGAGAANVTSRKVALVTGKVSGAGQANSTVSRVALVVGRVTGAGRATVTITSGAPTTPGTISVTAHAASITLTSRAATITLTGRPGGLITLEAT